MIISLQRYLFFLIYANIFGRKLQFSVNFRPFIQLFVGESCNFMLISARYTITFGRKLHFLLTPAR